MTTYNTGNPLGSTDPRDLYDNSENLDDAVNSDAPSWTDRFGKNRKSMAGMEVEFDGAMERFNRFIIQSGYQFLGDYAAGIKVTEYNQVVRDSSGEFWRLSGQVDLPYTTDGSGLPENDAFVPVGDAALRQELADPNRSLAVGRGVVSVESVAGLVTLPASLRRSDLRYLVRGYHTGSDVGGGEFYWDADRPAEDHDGGSVIYGNAEPPEGLGSGWEGWYSPQSGEAGCFVALLGDSVCASRYGADLSGQQPSDLPLLAALHYSASNNVEITTSGLVRLTRTLYQPRHSIINSHGIVFCEDLDQLDDGWLWRVMGESLINKTEIRRLVLSTYPTIELHSQSIPGRPMKGLQVSTPRVSIGSVYTYGFQLGGVEFGPTGYEILADTISCYVALWDPDHPDACGFKCSTADSSVDKLIVALYPVGVSLGSGNHFNHVHVWGIPSASNSPNYQAMLTGAVFGYSTTVNFLYVDSVDTLRYDDPRSGDVGCGVVFSDSASMISSLKYLGASPTKPEKIKLVNFSADRSVENVIGSLGAEGPVDTGAPIAYKSDSLKWRNTISGTVLAAANTFLYDPAPAPSLVTSFSGAMTIRKAGKKVTISAYIVVSSADRTSSAPLVINLPDGLGVRGGAMSIFEDSSIVNLPSSGLYLVSRTTSNTEGRLEVMYRDESTGGPRQVRGTDLRASGGIAFSLDVHATLLP